MERVTHGYRRARTCLSTNRHRRVEGPLVARFTQSWRPTKELAMMDICSGRSRNDSQVVLVGASVRAAAESALAAQLQPHSIDLFGDSDTRRASLSWTNLTQLLQDPAAVVLPSVPPGTPWIATGGMEKWADRLEQVRVNAQPLSELFLWPTATQRSQLRQPQFLAAAANFAGAVFPQWQWNQPVDGRGWLEKRLDSCGGCGVWDLFQRQTSRIGGTVASTEGMEQENLLPPVVSGQQHFFQLKMPGRCYGASFFARSGDVRLLGVCLNLRRCLGPLRYMYSGSLGPIRLADDHLQQLQRAANWIVAQTHLEGLFGLDFLVTGLSERLVFLEINPRYTASMELLERANSFSAIGLQSALRDTLSPLCEAEPSLQGVGTSTSCERGSFDAKLSQPGDCFWLKRVLWCKVPLVWREQVIRRYVQRFAGPFAERWTMHDTPQEASVIPAASPVATILLGPLGNVELGKALQWTASLERRWQEMNLVESL